MSVPNVLRWAGTWNNIRSYIYGDTVQSPANELPYANIVEIGSISGGADPSVNTAEWIEVPQSGGAGVSSIIAGTGISVDQSTGDVTVTNTGSGGGAAGNDTTIQYNAGAGTFGGSDEFTFGGGYVTVEANTNLWLKGALCVGEGGGGGSDGQVLTSTETGLEWTTLVEPPVYTAGTGIDIDLNNVISNLGALSLTAGTGITVGTAPDYTITNTNPAVTLTAGSGISVGTAPNYTIAADPSTLVLSDYTQITGALALTGTFASMTSVILTTTQASAPICIWGNLNVLDGGSGSTVEARLFCGTTTPTQTGPTITTTVTNAHNQTIPLIFKGIGPTVAGNVTWQLQARVTSGSASRVSAQIMVLGQMQNA